MSEEIAQVQNALVEAVTAQKMIEEKIEKAKADLALWRKRSESVQAQGDEHVAQEVGQRIRQLELMIAEFQADLMSQQDLQEQLKKTLYRLEHSVSLPPPPTIPNTDEADSTIERMENKIFEAEAFNELSSSTRDKERKIEQETQDLSLDAELEALKKSVKKKKTDK